MKNPKVLGIITGFLTPFLVLGIFFSFVTKTNLNSLDIEELTIIQNGKNIELSQFKKHEYYLINFWATWCAPCIEEMPLLDSLVLPFDVGIYALSDETIEKVEAFKAKRNFSNLKIYPFQTSEKLYKALPTTYLINSKGEILWSKSGKLNHLKDTQDELTSILSAQN